MDFSQVKSLTIPEGNVTKITDSSGRVLWQKITQGWHTVFEGSKKIGYGGQESKFVFGTVPYSDALKLRISFSELVARPYGNDDGDVSFTPSDRKSPVTYESLSSNLVYLVEAYCRNTTRGQNYTAYLIYNKTSGEIYGIASKYPSYATDAIAYITVTKIEA